MRAYRRLLTYRAVPRLLTAAALTRLAAPILNVALVLAVVATGGSYATGGLVVTGFSVALAISVPLSGRLADRLPLGGILAVLLAGQVLAYGLVLLALTRHWPAAVVILGAVAVGASTPPSTPLIRARWSALIPADQRRTAYALDAVLNEVMVVTGTTLTSAVISLASPVAAVALAGPATVGGALVLLSAPAAPPAAASRSHDSRAVLGALAHGPVRMALGIAALDMVAFGCVLVGVSVTATEAGTPAAAGLLMATFSAGFIVGGLLYGTRPAPTRPLRQLAAWQAAAAGLLILTGTAPGLLTVGAMLLGAGAVTGATNTLPQIVLSDLAPASQHTEAFAWMTTAQWAGSGLGAAAAGQLATATSGHHTSTFLAAGTAATLAAALALLLASSHTTRARLSST